MAPMTTPIMNSITDAVLNILFASGKLSSPILMPALGAPPRPTRLAHACIINVIGRTMPSAARASIPDPAILDTYILSTMLYKKVMSCAMTAGTARRKTKGSIFPRSNSSVISFFCLFLLILLLLLYSQTPLKFRKITGFKLAEPALSVGYI